MSEFITDNDSIKSNIQIRNRIYQGLKKPNGDKNYIRLSNMCLGDLLSHIQHSLVYNNRCILKILTGEDHHCIKMNDDIQKSIDAFAKDHITNDVQQSHPQNDDETDENYHDRICHIIMHNIYPDKLNDIKCDECIRKWLISSKW